MSSCREHIHIDPSSLQGDIAVLACFAYEHPEVALHRVGQMNSLGSEEVSSCAYLTCLRASV